MQVSYRQLITTFALISLFLIGFGTRRYIYEAQLQGLPSIPFTLESAIQYDMVETVYHTGTLPEVNTEIEYPEGVRTWQTYTIGAEYLYAGLARLLPTHWDLAERVRLVALIFFCLGIPFLAWWVKLMTGRRSAGLVSGFIYAVSIAAIIRSTGQELSRENVGIPMLLGFLALDAFARQRKSIGWAWAAGGTLALSQCSWDLIQYPVGVYFLSLLISPENNKGNRKRALIYTITLGIAGWANPYLRSHQYILSVPMLLAYGTVLGLYLTVNSPKKIGLRLCLAILPFTVLLIPVGEGNYNHFFDLLKAKLIFLNQKPQDPLLLNFNQRIMWVPALHSMNWPTFKAYFPAFLILSLIAMGVNYKKSTVSKNDQLFLTTWFILTLPATILFMRFHVFLIIPIAAWAGIGISNGLRKSTTWASISAVALGLAGLIEIRNVLSKPEIWGRPNIYFDQVNEMTQWLKENGKGRPVLANFGVSGSIYHYGACPVLLHPKFETTRIRERVEAYITHFFTRDEKAFSQWADEQGAQLFVLSMGELSDPALPIEKTYQQRYFANATNPPPHAAVRLLSHEPDKAKHFEQLWSNTKYRIFKIHTVEDKEMADQLTRLARIAMQAGELEEARERAVKALTYVKKHPGAIEILVRAEGLLQQGVKGSQRNKYDLQAPLPEEGNTP